ncbi:Ldh family oxidoreductase [Halomonas sp. QX-2]|uniref:Ldh family oxidoreductase n=1 Tax=Vreelandella sedimenti TaxID=2729618 RepID=A0A7Z0NCE8_9GAMM|nr:Ldh family oxidoreductase [Halomonas sedimenti]NYT75001.1 Ldh family oxidoreductase [Halomonas sedimenti]
MVNKNHYTFKKTVNISFDTMKEWVGNIFTASGLNEVDSSLVADSLVTADARGVYSHGVLRVSLYTKRILKRTINTSGKPEIKRSHLGTAVIEGNNCMGQVVGDYSMRLAIDKAKQHGISFITARGSNHYGTCAYYAMMALEEGMIGFTTTIGGGNLMAPWGGTDARIGNNPFGIAIPAFNHYPVVLDMAQSVVAKGKIVMATKTKTPIPEEWAFDKHGVPTTNADEAMEGTIRPIADYKGYGIATVMGMISSVISNASIGSSLMDVYEDFSGGLNKGHVFGAIDIKCMTEPLEFRKRMDREIDFIKNSPKAQGVESIYLPGEPEYISYALQKRNGIEYPIEIIEEIKQISGNFGVPSPL